MVSVAIVSTADLVAVALRVAEQIVIGAAVHPAGRRARADVVAAGRDAAPRAAARRAGARPVTIGRRGAAAVVTRLRAVVAAGRARRDDESGGCPGIVRVPNAREVGARAESSRAVPVGPADPRSAALA